MYTFEIIVEITENKKARLIIFEKDESGCRSVYNICEGDVDANYTMSFFGDTIELLNDEPTVLNENINFGRAKRWSAKVKKIIETLVKEDRYN